MLAKTTSLAQPMPSSVGGELGGAPDGVRHVEHGVHVDAGARGGDVDRRADALGRRERLGDRRDEPAVAVAGALVHERREAADEVDAHLVRGPVERERERRDVLGVGGGRELGDRGDRDALVDDRDAVLALDLLGDRHEPLGGAGDALVDAARP